MFLNEGMIRFELVVEEMKSGVVVFSLCLEGNHFLVEKVKLSIELAIGTLQDLELIFQFVNMKRLIGSGLFPR